ncbi:cytochrome c oxidase assembly protein cox11 mitochondrial [Phtheirospermum japonicum]|uniref:Cytochrome c oxidase assembly protein cox11 mitochondrial n=1 Tax=Phtheirospermum japonicum TaxID=374723 RepID=A0A830CG84_9LAMI|nr:cytochrome c oxidase assembly protein cox11 mitochondrial [Phtheirospermum japonicum]
MSLSRFSRGIHLFSCTKVPLHRAPFLSRHLLDAVGSRYSSFGGPNNDKIYSTFGFGSQRFMSKHGYKLRNYRLQESCSANFIRQYSTHATVEKKSQKMLLYLTGLVFAMVGCSYAAVPLYRRFCQATGYGGTVQRRESVEEKIARHTNDGTVTSREIIVQFNADVADGMPWKVKPGESALAFYTAENKSSTPITGVSTYNVTPMKV